MSILERNLAPEAALDMDLDTEVALLEFGLDHETVFPTGFVNQEFTFTLEGSVISVEPPLPQDIARRLVGEEWQFIKAAREEGADPSALRDVKGFKHHDYYYKNVLPREEVVNVFSLTAKRILSRNGSFVRCIRAA
jgi:hypothetical protein